MVLSLLQLEWLKYKKNKAFRVFFLGFVILLPAFMFIFKALPADATAGSGGMVSEQMFYEFPTVWKWVGYVGNWLTFFLFGFMGASLVTTEYSYKTLRQSIINGLSRDQYFLGKLYVILALSVFATVYYILVCLLFGFTHSSLSNSWYSVFGSEGISYVWRFFLMSLSYLTIGLFLGTLFKRTGLAIILYIAYTFFIEKLLRWMVHANIFKDKSMLFYPANATSDLMPMPFGSNEVGGMSRELGFSLYLGFTEAGITVIIYTLLMLFGAWQMIKKRDL